MIKCAECEKVLDKVPLWFETVKIRFVCDACRQVNPQQWLIPTVLDEEETEKVVEGDEEAFVEGEVSLEELEERDRKRLIGEGDDLFDADVLPEADEE